MTALRHNAIEMVEKMPENKLQYLIYIMQELDEFLADNKPSSKLKAFYTLEKMIKPTYDLDEKKELEEYRTEKYTL